MSPDISQKVMQMLDAIQAQIAPAAKATLTLALQVVHYNALGNLLVGFSGLLMLFICWIASKFFLKLKKQFDEKKEYRNDSFYELVWPIFYIGGIALTAFFGLILFFGNLFDIYTWVGIFDPKAYLAHQIMQKFIGG